MHTTDLRIKLLLFSILRAILLPHVSVYALLNVILCFHLSHSWGRFPCGFHSMSCPTFCNPMDYSTLCFPVLHYLSVFAQTLMCIKVGDAHQISLFPDFYVSSQFFLILVTANTKSYL